MDKFDLLIGMLWLLLLCLIIVPCYFSITSLMNNEPCKDLGYDGARFFEGYCYKNYPIKGGHWYNVCTMSLEENATVKEWCINQEAIIDE
jgi:hypothetical protein